MNDAIDGLDELPAAGFGFREGKSRTFLRQLGEAIGWTILLVGFALAMIYLTPPQRSAEADLFDAECREKGVAP